MLEKKSIKNWLDDDKPREKLISKGPKSLSNSELLAIIIATGTSKLSALDISKIILDSVDNNWDLLSKLSFQDFLKFQGIGQAKAVSIITILEIAKRKNLQLKPIHPIIKSSKDVFEFLMPDLMNLPHEEFWVVFLNQANKVLSKEQISKGGINQTTLDIRVVLKKALNVQAVSIILGHNHPSGNIKPSQEDIKITKKIKEAANLLDIQVLDHIIIGYQEFYSFSDANIL